MSWAITSAMVLCGELAGSTNTLYSVVRRASGVACIRFSGERLVIRPPSITAPITIIWWPSPLAPARKGARPSAPAAPPLLS